MTDSRPRSYPDIVERLREPIYANSHFDPGKKYFDPLRIAASSEIERLRSVAQRPVERMWCKDCGTVSRDDTCDCCINGGKPNFVNYADAMQESAQEMCERVIVLEKALRHAFQIADLEWRFAGAHPFRVMILDEMREALRACAQSDMCSESVTTDSAAYPLPSTLHSSEKTPRIPKVRTSHHRNNEEAARLQALVDKKYASDDRASPHSSTRQSGET